MEDQSERATRRDATPYVIRTSPAGATSKLSAIWRGVNLDTDYPKFVHSFPSTNYQI